MKDDSRLKGIIALAVVTVIAFGVIYGSRILVKDEAKDNNDNGAVVEDLPGAIDVSGAEGIVAAREITDGGGNVTSYSVTAEATGFNAGFPITMEVIFENDALTIQEVKLISHAETPGYGKKMEEDNYLDQFKGMTATDAESIDVISGATVTTNALVDLVNTAYNYISSYAGN
ncbi:MAG: FMN-binding protein [Clostridiales bacterium]|nr:FMN-binding protein [Clostridiales bacterium]